MSPTFTLIDVTEQRRVESVRLAFEIADASARALLEAASTSTVKAEGVRWRVLASADRGISQERVEMAIRYLELRRLETPFLFFTHPFRRRWIRFENLK